MRWDTWPCGEVESEAEEAPGIGVYNRGFGGVSKTVLCYGDFIVCWWIQIVWRKVC